MKSNNPSIREKTFEFSEIDFASGTMTMNGAINKAGILLVILASTAAIGWNLESHGIAMVCAVLALLSALAIAFLRETAPLLAPVYSAFKGLVVGTLAAFFNRSHPGIAANALTLTFTVFGLMLGIYRLDIFSMTPRFKKSVMIATLAVAAVYLLDLFAAAVGLEIHVLHRTSVFGILVSVVVTVIAALNLLLDFDIFELNAERSPKFMEWYCAFSLIVTLAWLYVEMLRLLSKLQRR